MHAEHADNSEMNELSGRLICCAFTALSTFRVGSLSLSAVQRYGDKECYKDILASDYFVDLLLNFGKPRRFICGLCVHRLSASALKFFLGLPRHMAGNANRGR